jgi:hypothetical protein
MELPSISPDRLGRRSKRYAIEPLITPQIPRHTHPSELMVISHSHRVQKFIVPRIFIIVVTKLDSDSCNFKVNSRQQRKAFRYCAVHGIGGSRTLSCFEQLAATFRTTTLSAGQLGRPTGARLSTAIS